MARLSASTSAVNRAMPFVRGDGGQVLQQEGRQASALVLVGHREGHLGLVLAGPAVVAGIGDDLVAQQRDERHTVGHVHRGEPLDLGFGQPGLGREEAVVERSDDSPEWKLR